MTGLPALRSDLLRHQLDGDLMIYDKVNDQVHLLNASTAAVVTYLGQGLSRGEVIEKLAEGGEIDSGASILALALDELARARLLAEKVDAAPALGVETRRQMLQKVAALGALLVIPAILTLTPSTGAAQGSLLGLGAACSRSNVCASGCCGDKAADSADKDHICNDSDKDCVVGPNLPCGCKPA